MPHLVRSWHFDLLLTTKASHNESLLGGYAQQDRLSTTVVRQSQTSASHVHQLAQVYTTMTGLVYVMMKSTSSKNNYSILTQRETEREQSIEKKV